MARWAAGFILYREVCFAVYVIANIFTAKIIRRVRFVGNGQTFRANTTLMKILRIFLLCFVGLLLATVALATWKWTLLQRAMSYPAATEITSADWYEPLAKIEGNFSTPLPTADSMTIQAAALKQLSDYAEERNSSALLVMHRDKILLEKYWRDKNAESKSNSMSMAKTIVGLLIGKAIEEGKLKSEEEMAATYIEEWREDERSKISIKDLLYMQSGLRNEDDTTDPFSDLIWMYIDDDVEENTIHIPSLLPPATEYDYNNANTQMLGLILERATGMPIEQYASEKLWKPIEAKDAGWWLDREGGMPKVFCCYFASPRDWLRIGKLMLQKGKWNEKQVIAESWIEKMLVPSTLERDYGYHLWLGFEEGGAKDEYRNEMYLEKVFTIDGANKQQVCIVPNAELLIVRIGEKPQDWDEGLFVNTLLRGIEE